MQKLTLSFMFVAVFFITACDIGPIAVPKTLTVKGEPGMHIPFGSPFRNADGTLSDSSPEKLLSKENMKKMIAGDLPGARVYSYDDAVGTYTEKDMQAFLVRYPIAEMPYDLSGYMQHDITIPPVTITVPGEVLTAANASGNSIDHPLAPITVSLGDLGTLVSSVTKTKLGIRIKGNYAGKLAITIQGGEGFTFSAKNGTYDSASGYTEYTDPAPIWKPLTAPYSGAPAADKGKVIITVIVKTAITGTIAPEFVLEWTEATVNPGGNGVLEDSKDGLDLHSLTEVFKGAEFTGPIEAQIYLSGLPSSTSSLSLGYNNAEDSTKNKINLIGDSTPWHGVDGWESVVNNHIVSENYTGDLPPDSLVSSAYIDFTNVINAAINNEQALNYKVSMGSTKITKGGKGGSIEVVLLIKIPFMLQIEGEPPTIDFSYTDPVTAKTTTQADYVGLSLDGLPDLGNDDLFGRKDKDDKIFVVIGGVKTMTIILESFKNELFDGYIAVKSREGSTAANGEPTKSKLSLLEKPEHGNNLKIPLEEFEYPVAPQFEILIPKAPGTDKSSLKVKRGGKFDFNLAVEMQTILNHEVEF